MNPDDAHPSNQQDPQWDELVENFRQLDAAAPREPSAEERKAQLEKRWGCCCACCFSARLRRSFISVWESSPCSESHTC